MTILRGLIGVLVALAVTVGFMQFLELMLANTLAGGQPLRSIDDYAIVLNPFPVLVMRLLIASLVALLGGYLCAKIAEHDEMRYVVIAAIFRIIAIGGGTVQGWIPPASWWSIAVMLSFSTLAMLAGGAVRSAAARVQK